MLFGSQCGIAGFAAALAVLAYPVFAACRQVRRTDWRSPQSIFALVPGISCLILSAGILLDVGFETPAYAGVLIAFSLLVLMRDAPSEPVGSHGDVLPRIVAGLLMFFTAAVFRVSWSVFQEDKAYSALLHEVNHPEYSFEHRGDPGYVPSLSRVQSLLKNALRASSLNAQSPFPWKVAADYMFKAYMFTGGHPDRAMTCIDRAIELDPLQSSRYVERACMRYKIADETVTDEVRRDLETARRLTPKNPELDRPDAEICREAFIRKEQ
jgi:hypothetical protein